MELDATSQRTPRAMDRAIDEVKRRGFTVLPGVFSPDELEILRSLYRHTEAKSSRPMGEVATTLTAWRSRCQSLQARIDPIVESFQHGGIAADTMHYSLAFVTPARTNYDFHSDSAAEAMTHGNENSLRLWIPIDKVSAREDGLDFLRMDDFLADYPECSDLIRNHGAVRIEDDEIRIFHPPTPRHFPLNTRRSPTVTCGVSTYRPRASA
jgi:hypothetical protein